MENSLKDFRASYRGNYCLLHCWRDIGDPTVLCKYATYQQYLTLMEYFAEFSQNI